MTTDTAKIVYTKTDEAPMLATYSLLPIINRFVNTAGIELEISDISLAARIIASFPERLTDEQKMPDALSQLGEYTQDPMANIIKLPNISASIPQLKAAIKELQDQGYDVPEYPDSPSTDEEKDFLERYSKVLGSAVNPVLREGNSDRRAPAAVKEYARKHPHSMGKWSQASRTHVAHMRDGDFYHSDISTIVEKAGNLKIELVEDNGNTITLKEAVKVEKDEVIDAAFMSVKKLTAFLEEEIEGAKRAGILFSLHMKATMMKVSDPIIFGHAVRVYFKEAFDKYGETFKKIGVNPNSGLGNVYQKVSELPFGERTEIEEALHACYENRPEMAMVDSDKGITNLHVPSDVIIDASMPAMIRIGGKMWGMDGKTKDTKAVIPDSSYATVFQETHRDVCSN